MERQLCYQAALREVNMQQKSSEARCRLRPALHKTDKPAIKPSQPPSRVQIIMAIVAHSLPWNFVRFADYTAIAEYNEVSNAHKCMPMLQTFT